ncbi:MULTISPECIES: ParA family protein [Pseudomonas]|uniref:ParA family protein n=1 Tax=Pseudomonas TaxID=286 RepID=UPI002579E9A6|nr:AAA family ATPase [Pseudomonas sp.]
MAAAIISCINLKGGVGKTALAVNLAAYCGIQDKKTLLIDLDPQTNASFSSIGVQAWQDHVGQHGSVADLLGARKHTSADGTTKNAHETIITDVFENVDLIPSHIDLFTVDLDLAGATSRETRLRRALKDVIDEYDVIICDCPPNLTIPTQNALAVSTHYVVPVSLDFLSAIGVGLLLKRVQEFCTDLEHSLENIGVVISRVGRPALHRDETEATLRKQFGKSVIKTKITERVAVSRCAQQQISIFESKDETSIAEFSLVCKTLLKTAGVI